MTDYDAINDRFPTNPHAAEHGWMPDHEYNRLEEKAAFAKLEAEQEAATSTSDYLGPLVSTPLTHNGKFTVKSLRTGDHRTFRVRTQPQDSSFAPGKRVLSLLTGSDNMNSYKGFAFIVDGHVNVWKSKKSNTYIAYAAMLEKLAQHVLDGKVEVFAETRCRICNRTLTTPESIVSGIGPVCEGRTS